MKFLILLFLLSSLTISAQTVTDLINQLDTTKLNLALNEFSGEVATLVGGNTVTILNRTSTQNSTAADYIREQLTSFGNLTITTTNYSTNGTNVIATQVGEINPNDAYIVCAHYDAVENYCADDNGTGVTAMLETARILSKYCVENTIIYAFFDEEEDGLLGSINYATQVASGSLNIRGVINLDMLGYDANQANDAPIHVRNIANSLTLKDDAVNVLNAHSASIGLTPTVVNPGVEHSDHKSFWDQGINAIMITDAAAISQISPFYHSANDRVSTLHLPYFYKMTKFIIGMMATKGVLVNSSSCTVSTSNIQGTLDNIEVFPNPASKNISIKFDALLSPNASIQIVDVMGSVIRQQTINQELTSVNTEQLPKGTYFLKIRNEKNTVVKKIAIY